MKDIILGLWDCVERQGINMLKHFLQGSDFFEAPCSTEFHLCRPGGLSEHSLNVYKLLLEKVERYKLSISTQTVIVCGLGHDLCKANFYVKGTKNVKENGVWKEKQVYLVKDQFPMGHGEKSVSILQDFIGLTEEEKLAIRWHMVAFDAGIHFGYPSGFAFREAVKKFPLVTLLFTADYEASQILEV
jgi:hypothetical protein